jgi:hypothetical protein
MHISNQRPEPPRVEFYVNASRRQRGHTLPNAFLGLRISDTTLGTLLDEVWLDLERGGHVNRKFTLDYLSFVHYPHRRRRHFYWAFGRATWRESEF